MSVLLQTIEGEDYTILPHAPDWTTKPKRTLAFLDGLKQAATGAESRISLRTQATHALGWEILPFDFLEEKLLEQRLLDAAARGLAIAPYWGRGTKLQEDTAGDTVIVYPTRWPFYDGQLLFFRQPGVENFEAWEFGEVIAFDNSLSSRTELTLDAMLSDTYPAGAICWPVIWGKVEIESLQALHLGRGSIQVRITQRKPFPSDALLSCIGIYQLFETDVYAAGEEVTTPALLIDGCGFAAGPDIGPNLVASVAFEPFERYSVGATSAFSRGAGWNGAADVADNYVNSQAEETFEDYTAGAVTGGDLDQGTGWVATPDIA